jgi:glyoxylase I family protein
VKIEHVAYMVADPLAMVRWYVQHLGLTVKRGSSEPPYGHFLADAGGAVLVELYGGSDSQVPNYHQIDPAVLHLALLSTDLAKDHRRLLSAGASEVSGPKKLSNGDSIAMLRDPWGLAVQLVQRAEPMLGQ